MLLLIINNKESISVPENLSKITTELLIRLDERMSSLQKEIKSLHEEIDDLKKDLKSIKNDNIIALKSYVTKEEFSPIQKSLYGVASLIIMTVVGTLLSLVISK